MPSKPLTCWAGINGSPFVILPEKEASQTLFTSNGPWAETKAKLSINQPELDSASVSNFKTLAHSLSSFVVGELCKAKVLFTHVLVALNTPDTDPVTLPIVFLSANQ